MGPVCKIAVEDDNLPGLDCAHAGNERQQGGLADPIGSDHPHHLARWNIDRDIVERDRRSIMVRDVLESGDDSVRH